MVSKIASLSLRAWEFICTLIFLGLIGDMISDAVGGNTSIVNYSMFAAVVSMLSLFYLIPATVWDGLGPAFVMVIVDLANVLILFCGAVALAAELGVHSCDNKSYINHNKITDGTQPDNRTTRCREAQASCAFMWFAWASYVASAVLSFLESRSSGFSTGGIVRRGPSMRQVR